jgi:hypothetical protein
MNADIINLRQARKKKARIHAEKSAADNRVRFGLTKAERAAAKTAKDDTKRGLDGHRLDKPKPGNG